MSLRAGWLAGKSKRKHDKVEPEREEVSPGESCPSCLSWATCQQEGCMLGTLAGSISLSGQVSLAGHRHNAIHLRLSSQERGSWGTKSAEGQLGGNAGAAGGRGAKGHPFPGSLNPFAWRSPRRSPAWPSVIFSLPNKCPSSFLEVFISGPVPPFQATFLERVVESTIPLPSPIIWALLRQCGPPLSQVPVESSIWQTSFLNVPLGLLHWVLPLEPHPQGILLLPVGIALSSFLFSLAFCPMLVWCLSSSNTTSRQRFPKPVSLAPTPLNSYHIDFFLSLH